MQDIEHRLQSFDVGELSRDLKQLQRLVTDKQLKDPLCIQWMRDAMLVLKALEEIGLAQ